MKIARVVDRDTGRGIGFISESVDERVCVSWCVWVLGHEGVGAVKLYVVVSEEAGGNVGGGVEGDGGGVGVECEGDVAGDSIGRDLSEASFAREKQMWKIGQE